MDKVDDIWCFLRKTTPRLKIGFLQVLSRPASRLFLQLRLHPGPCIIVRSHVFQRAHWYSFQAIDISFVHSTPFQFEYEILFLSSSSFNPLHATRFPPVSNEIRFFPAIMSLRMQSSVICATWDVAKAINFDFCLDTSFFFLQLIAEHSNGSLYAFNILMLFRQISLNQLP